VIAYAQCWEDADVLLSALEPRPGQRCLSIASAGDNTLALLAHAPAEVVAVDTNPAQLACLELRVAGYRVLEHDELLELIGSRPSTRREALYRRCREFLGAEARAFWDARPGDVAIGIGAAGRLERYLALFRRRVLPVIHPQQRIEQLLRGGTRAERERFYDREWDSWSWRSVFRVFFSRTVMAHTGRSRSQFRYAERPLAQHLLARLRHACIELDPAANPYLRWILTGSHGPALPFALRAENFDPIRAHLGCLRWHHLQLEELLARTSARTFDRCNLSNAFEYVSNAHYEATLRALLHACRPRARLAYWNLLVPRRRPASLAERLVPLGQASRRLHREDKAFFYGDFVLEEAV
jgi:S-adenosylmethionine-diacylglycerol 3-amino-3-carboxypropyl transferase